MNKDGIDIAVFYASTDEEALNMAQIFIDAIAFPIELRFTDHYFRGRKETYSFMTDKWSSVPFKNCDGSHHWSRCTVSTVNCIKCGKIISHEEYFNAHC